MTPEAQTILKSWSAPLGVEAALCVVTLVYVIGWLCLRRVAPGVVSLGRLVAFLAGMISLSIAIGSPLEAFDDAALSLHMVQHLLLMVVAPPLILLGSPALPFLRGLPRALRGGVGRLLAFGPVQRLGNILTNPAVCWIAATVALIAWHIPAAFELALRSSSWHEFEHASFFATSLMFWWPVIRPFPGVVKWPNWSIPLYLFLGTLPGGVLGAFLAFSDRVVYPSYETTPVIFHRSPLEDQVFAGALMWVLGTFVYALPAVILVFQLLSGKTTWSNGRATRRPGPQVILTMPAQK